LQVSSERRDGGLAPPSFSPFPFSPPQSSPGPYRLFFFFPSSFFFLRVSAGRKKSIPRPLLSVTLFLPFFLLNASLFLSLGILIEQTLQKSLESALPLFFPPLDLPLVGLSFSPFFSFFVGLSGKRFFDEILPSPFLPPLKPNSLSPPFFYLFRAEN